MWKKILIIVAKLSIAGLVIGGLVACAIVIYFSIARETPTSEKVNIYFNSNISSGYDKTITLKTGEYLELDEVPNIVRNDYNFLGWYDDFDLKYSFDTPFLTDTTLNAKWEEKKEDTNIELCTITYYYGYDNKVETVDYRKGTIIGAGFPTPKRAESKYVFKGWKTRPDLSGSYNFNEPIMSNATVYARWDIVLPGITDYDGNSELFEEYRKQYEESVSTKVEEQDETKVSAKNTLCESENIINIRINGADVHKDSSSSTTKYVYYSNFTAHVTVSQNADIYNNKVINSISSFYEGDLTGKVKMSYNIKKDTLTMEFVLTGELDAQTGNKEINTLVGDTGQIMYNTYDSKLSFDYRAVIGSTDGKEVFTSVTKIGNKANSSIYYQANVTESCGATFSQKGSGVSFDGKIWGGSVNSPEEIFRFGKISSSITGEGNYAIKSSTNGQMYFTTDNLDFTSTQIIKTKK